MLCGGDAVTLHCSLDAVFSELKPFPPFFYINSLTGSEKSMSTNGRWYSLVMLFLNLRTTKYVPLEPKAIKAA